MRIRINISSWYQLFLYMFECNGYTIHTYIAHIMVILSKPLIFFCISAIVPFEFPIHFLLASLVAYKNLKVSENILRLKKSEV